MERKNSLKIILIVLGGTLTVLLTILTLVPFLNNMFFVEVIQSAPPLITQAALPDTPETMPVTVYYIMESNSKKISAVYIEVFPVGSDTVTYLELPADTKVNLSEELYKSLQSYAPELPQYFKLSNMAESFSEEYGLTGCNRILSELLGVSLTEYVRAEAEAFEDWKSLPEKDISSSSYFEQYSRWVEQTSSSRTAEERWSYYESRRKVCKAVIERASGSREKDGYLLSGKRSKERLEELMQNKAGAK